MSQHDTDEEAASGKGPRKQASVAAQIGRAVLWLGTVVGAASTGGWYNQHTAGLQQQAAQEIVDIKAREQVALLKIELLGKFDLTNQKLDQISEQIREIKRERKPRSE